MLRRHAACCGRYNLRMPSDEPLPRIELEVASIHLDTAAELQKRLREIGIEADEQRIMLFSAEPPAWVEIIANASTWQKVIGGAAGLYCAGLLKAAGEETWKSRKELARAVIQRVGPGVQRIREFVRAVAAVKLDRRKDVTVSIVGDNMRFRLFLADEDEAIHTVATSVYLMQRIRTVIDEIKDRVSEDNRLLGKVDVTVGDDGFTVEWTSPEPWTRFARDYNLEGKPKGEAYTPRRG